MCLAQLRKGAAICLGIVTDYGVKGSMVLPLSRETYYNSETPTLEL